LNPMFVHALSIKIDNAVKSSAVFFIFVVIIKI
jgi:hypothetical protein